MGVAALADLFADLVRAKSAEAEAKAARLACEDAILARIDTKRDRGTVSFKDGPVKCSVKFALNYKADVEAMREHVGGDVACALKHVPATWEFDEKAYEALRESNPTLFAKVSKFVTTKPAKPAMELKL